jgi:hypothetical protein
MRLESPGFEVGLEIDFFCRFRLDFRCKVVGDSLCVLAII